MYVFLDIKIKNDQKRRVNHEIKLILNLLKGYGYSKHVRVMLDSTQLLRQFVECPAIDDRHDVDMNNMIGPLASQGYTSFAVIYPHKHDKPMCTEQREYIHQLYDGCKQRHGKNATEYCDEPPKK